jgi:AraC-like DNA-binding protein
MIDNLHIRLFQTNWETIGPGWWNIKNLQRNYWRFYFNPTDGAVLEVEDTNHTGIYEKYPLYARQPYFIPAGVHFNSTIAVDIPHFYIHFDIIGIPTLAMSTLFNTPISLPHSERLVQTTWEVAQAVHANGQLDLDLIMQCRIKVVIYEGLALYLQSLPAEQLEHPLQLAIALKPVLPAIHYIDTNLEKPLLNRDLAHLCQMNEDYFIRRFKECVGQPPGSYIREQRVKQAAQGLLFTENSLEQIATATGFGSRFYFAKVFKDATGFSPAAYRKTSRV